MTLYEMLKTIVQEGSPYDPSMHCQYCRKQGDHHPSCVWIKARGYVVRQEAERSEK